jgi:hypothetical protein
LNNLEAVAVESLSGKWTAGLALRHGSGRGAGRLGQGNIKLVHFDILYEKGTGDPGGGAALLARMNLGE